MSFVNGNWISGLDTVTGAQGFWSYPVCAVGRAQGAGCSSAASRRPVEDGHGVLWDSPQDYNISTTKCAGRQENNHLINDWTGSISLVTRHQRLKEELTKLMWGICFISYGKQMTNSCGQNLWNKLKLIIDQRNSLSWVIHRWRRGAAGVTYCSVMA